MDLNAVSYGNGTWLALGTDQGIVLRSTDGIVWEETAVSSGPPAGVTALRFLHDRFIAKGLSLWKQSFDGVTWSDFPIPPGSVVNDVTFARGSWVCVGAAGLFASAQEPGEWEINQSATTSSPVHRVIYLGGRFHAYSYWSTGMQPFSSRDGHTWTIHPQTKGVWFDHLEHGQIERAGGSVEAVVVGTLQGGAYHIGRAAGEALAWETGRREGVFGRLIYRRSADAAGPGLARREWVSLASSRGHSARGGLPVFSLRTAGEAPVFENTDTLNGILAVAAGPGAMIAVGTGGLIRRYPTGLTAGRPLRA